jgi:serine protease
MVKLRNLARLAIAAVVVLGGMAAIGVAPVGASGGTLYVNNTLSVTGNDTSCSTAGYLTISSAVTAAASGDTVQVCPGTYAEQVTVTTPNLTITGPASGSPPAIIEPTTVACNTTDMAAVVFVSGVSGVTVENLTVNGSAGGGTTFTSCSSSPQDFWGVVYQNASGTITGDSVLNMTPSTNFSGGNNEDSGIYVQSSTGTSTVTISLNKVSGYQKNGITCNDAHTNCSITKNTVTGPGPISTEAQNGIQVGFGATGTVSSNIVSDSDYTFASTATASGILIIQASDTSVTGNLLTDDQHAIVLESVGGYDGTSGWAMTGDAVSTNQIGYSSSYTSNNANATNDATGIDVVFYNTGYNVVSEAPSVSAVVENNTVNGPGAFSLTSPVVDSSPVGLQVQGLGGNSGTGSLTVSAAGNLFENWVADVMDVGTTSGTDATTLSGNSFVSAPVGVDNVSGTTGSYTTQVTDNATDNWWGSSTGPTATTNSGGTGSSASANVTFSPWLATVSLTPASQAVRVGSSATVQATLLDNKGATVSAPLSVIFTPSAGSSSSASPTLSSGAASFTFSDSSVQSVTVGAAIAFGSPLVPSGLAGSATVDFVAPPPPPPPAPTPPPPPPGTVSSASGTSTSSTGTASATNDQTTASGTGVGALTVAQYSSDPVGSPTFSSAGEYFDVALSSGNSFTATTIKDCNLNGGNSLQWWNPQANAGVGGWEPVSPSPTYTAGPPACVSVALTSSTRPTLAELTGTVFAVATTGSAYTALAPTRLLDTRTTGGTLGPSGSLNLTVTGGSVPSNATAVALNVTATNTTATSYLTIYPAGGSRPIVSNLNWTQGETVPNLVIVPVGSNGQVSIYNYTGKANVVVDLEGYFAPEAAGSTAGSYVPLTPARITDTRSGSTYPNAGKTLAAGGSLNVQVTGKGGVPSSGVTGAILNVTVTNTTAAGYLTAYPQGATRPLASNLNWGAGETVANRVVVPVSSTGMITLYNYAGSTDVVVDVSGYFTNGSSTPANASLYNPITPVRVLDTRTTGTPLSGGATLTVPMVGVDGIASNATAVVTNVTAANTTAASYFTVFPGGTRPTVSDVNWMAGQIVPNLTLATLSGTGSISIYNHAGSAAVIVDAFGYFSPG